MYLVYVLKFENFKSSLTLTLDLKKFQHQFYYKISLNFLSIFSTNSSLNVIKDFVFFINLRFFLKFKKPIKVSYFIEYGFSFGLI